MGDKCLPIADRPLRWLFLDLNSYFASIEQAENPELRGKPVVVAPVDSDSTCAIAASYPAKAYGIKTGTNIGEAKRLCPELIVCNADHTLYVHYHERILKALDSVIPMDKVCSIDEMRYRLLGSETRPEGARQVALQMKDALKGVAPSLTCSIGIAPNPFVAKLGTEMQKPDGLTIIEGHELPQKLGGRDLTFFTGINFRMAARLKASGIMDSTDMVRASEKALRRAFGSIVGARWWHLLRGYELPEEETDQKSLSHSHVLPPELRHEEGCRAVLLRLVQKAAMRLRKEDLWAKHMSVHVRGLEQSWKASTALPPTQDAITVTKQLLRLWQEADYSRPKAVGVVFTELQKREAVTPSLFEDTVPLAEVSREIDRMNARFGKNSIYLASLSKAKDTASEKIAFQKTGLLQEGAGDNEWTGTRRPPRNQESGKIRAS